MVIYILDSSTEQSVLDIISQSYRNPDSMNIIKIFP